MAVANKSKMSAEKPQGGAFVGSRARAGVGASGRARVWGAGGRARVWGAGGQRVWLRVIRSGALGLWAR